MAALAIAAVAFLNGIAGKSGEQLVEKEAAPAVVAGARSSKARPIPPGSTAQSATPATAAAGPCRGIRVVDSQKRLGIAAQIHRALVDKEVGDMDDPVVQVDAWPAQAKRIAEKRPCVVAIHLHSLQPLYIGDADKGVRRSEAMLLRGLRALVDDSPATSIVIFSSSFAEKENGSALKTRLRQAVADIVGGDRAAEAELTAITSNAARLHWPNVVQPTVSQALADELEQVVAIAQQKAIRKPTARGNAVPVT